MSTAPAAAPRFSSLRWFLLGVFVLVPLINYLSFAFGRDDDRFADDAMTRVDAAGYAFSIWGLIFAGMLLFSFMVVRALDGPGTPHLRQAVICLIIAGAASIAFVPISLGGNQVLGWFDLLTHLLPLIAANVALRRHVAAQPSASGWRWTYVFPSIYLGWISAATVIATALMLDQLGVRFAPETEIVGGAVLAFVLTLIGLYLTNRQDVFYGLTVAWALVAVGIEQADAALIQYVAWGGAVLLIVFAALRLFGPRVAFYARPI